MSYSRTRNDLAKMKYDEFDQYMRSNHSSPGLNNAEQFEKDALTLLHYLQDAANLSDTEKCLLHWHAGQDYAKSGQKDLAILQFNLAGEYKNEMIVIFGPAANAYQKATIAFLNKDKESIGHQLQECMTIPITEYPHTNVVLVPGRIHDMYNHPDATYDEIFSMKPTLPPLSGKHDWFKIHVTAEQSEGQIVGAYRRDLEIDQLGISNSLPINKSTRSGSEPSESALPKWQENLITSICTSVKNNYVFADSIEQTALKKKLYENFIRINSEFPSADKETFCAEVNKVLKEIDPHLILQYDPPQIAGHLEHKRVTEDPRKNGCAQFMLDGLDPPESWYEKFKKENYGFDESPPKGSTAIPEPIGYIKINDFLDPRDGLGRIAQEKAHEILGNMRGKRAIVIDLRDSHGGSPEMVEFIMSYLLTEADKAKIKDGVYNRIYDQSTEKSKDYSVRPTEFNLNVPICVLTNDKTFSAAEEFSYDLQQINKHVLKDNRFVIIGETTRGGAHAMTGFPLVNPDSREVNKDYFLWVPTRTTANPYTHTNWEDGPKKLGKTPGVEPDSGFEIKKGKDALDVAVTHLTSMLAPTPSLDEKKSASMQSTTAKTAVMLGIPASTLTSPPAPEQDSQKEKSVSAQSTTVRSTPEERVDSSAVNSQSTVYKTPTPKAPGTFK